MADNFPKSQIVLLELPACLYVYQQPAQQPATSTPPQHTASGTSHTTQALCDRVPFGSRGASRMEAHMHCRLMLQPGQLLKASQAAVQLKVEAAFMLGGVSCTWRSEIVAGWLDSGVFLQLPFH